MTDKSRAKKILPKSVILQEYRNRLSDNIRTLNDNFREIIHLAKIDLEQQNNSSLKQINRVTSYAVEQYEMEVRAANMARAAEGIRRLIADLKQYLILNDFTFVNQCYQKAVLDSEEAVKEVDIRLLNIGDEIALNLAEIEQEELTSSTIWTPTD